MQSTVFEALARSSAVKPRLKDGAGDGGGTDIGGGGGGSIDISVSAASPASSVDGATATAASAFSASAAASVRDARKLSVPDSSSKSGCLISTIALLDVSTLSTKDSKGDDPFFSGCAFFASTSRRSRVSLVSGVSGTIGGGDIWSRPSCPSCC